MWPCLCPQAILLCVPTGSSPAPAAQRVRPLGRVAGQAQAHRERDPEWGSAGGWEELGEPRVTPPCSCLRQSMLWGVLMTPAALQVINTQSNNPRSWGP